jgi:hypothetical protein
VRDQPAPFFANRYIETALFAFLKGTGGEDFQIGDNLEVLPIGPAIKGLKLLFFIGEVGL